MQKKLLRAQIRSEKGKYSMQEKGLWSETICNTLLNEELIKESDVIMAYYPLADEVDVTRVIDTLAVDGKLVLLPEVVSDSEMILREYNGVTDLKKGAFSIYEPTGTIYDKYEEIDVAIIPGMAFDKKGNRLGRGKGYYDRFLSKMKEHTSALPHLVGVCFPFQIVDEVPCEEYDYPIDKLVTAL